MLLGAPEKFVNSISPDYAASGEQDAKNAPGYRSAGGVGAMAFTGPLDLAGEAVSAGAKSAVKAIAGVAEKKIVNNRAADIIAGAGGAATKGERKALLSADEPVKEMLATPAGEQIAKEAYADPATAAKTAGDWISKVNETRAPDYGTIDKYMGGWNPHDAYDFVMAKKALVKTGEPEKEVALQSLANEIKRGYKIEDATAPTVAESAPIAREISPEVQSRAAKSLDDIMRSRAGLSAKQKAITPSQLARESIPEAVGSEETAQLTSPNFTPPKPGISGDPNAGYSPVGGIETPTSENATARISRELPGIPGENQKSVELRDFTTRLLKKTGDTEKDNAARLQHDVMHEFLDQHLDAAAKIDPAAKEAVERIREASRNTMALYKIKNALETRATNKAISVAKGAGLGATIGLVEGVANGRDPVESAEHAIKGAIAGAVLHKGMPLARHAGNAAIGVAGKLAGKVPVPSGRMLSRAAKLSEIAGNEKR